MEIGEKSYNVQLFNEYNNNDKWNKCKNLCQFSSSCIQPNNGQCKKCNVM